jgi:hypothetical protein
MDEITEKVLATKIPCCSIQLAVVVPRSRLGPERLGLGLELYAEAADHPRIPVVMELGF